MSPHTPGPWLIQDNTVYALNDDAHPSNRFYAGVQVGHVGGNVRTDEREIAANARLIAAAPDLLYFARFVLRGLEDGSVKSKPILDFDNSTAQEVKVISLHSMARAAIAKATGEDA